MHHHHPRNREQKRRGHALTTKPRKTKQTERVHMNTNSHSSNLVVMEVEIDIARTQTIGSDKLGIARRTLILGVASQHALNAETNTFHILYRGPSLSSK